MEDDRILRVQSLARRFEVACQHEFAFLVDEYGFRLDAIDRTGSTRSLTFINQTTGVRIQYLPREGGVFIFLARLVDGRYPPDPLFVQQDIVLDSFDFVDLLRLRGGAEVRQELDGCYDLGKVEALLNTYAHEMAHIAKDVLSGDFSSFSDLDRIVKNRAEYFRKEF